VCLGYEAITQYGRRCRSYFNSVFRDYYLPMRCLQDACARVLRIHYSRRLVEHLEVFWDEVLPSSVRFVSVLRLARGGAQNRQQGERTRRVYGPRKGAYPN